MIGNIETHTSTDTGTIKLDGIDFSGVVETHTGVPVCDIATDIIDFAEVSDIIPTVPTCLRHEETLLDLSGHGELGDVDLSALYEVCLNPGNLPTVTDNASQTQANEQELLYHLITYRFDQTDAELDIIDARPTGDNCFKSN